MNLKTAKLRDRKASYISARGIAQAQVPAMDSIAMAKAIALATACGESQYPCRISANMTKRLTTTIRFSREKCDFNLDNRSVRRGTCDLDPITWAAIGRE